NVVMLADSCMAARQPAWTLPAQWNLAEEHHGTVAIRADIRQPHGVGAPAAGRTRGIYLRRARPDRRSCPTDSAVLPRQARRRATLGRHDRSGCVAACRAAV